MNKTFLLMAILMLPLGGAWLFHPGQKNESNRPKGSEIAIKWELITNNYSGQQLFKSNLTLSNKSNAPLLNNNWELYFTHSICRRILEDSIPASLKIQRIAGDYYKLTPTSSFPILGPQQDFTFSIISRDFVTKYSDAPSGFYFVFFDQQKNPSQPEDVIHYTVEKFMRAEQMATGEWNYAKLLSPEKSFIENKALSFISLKSNPRIIPSPLHTIYNSGHFQLSRQTVLYYQDGLEKEANYLVAAIRAQFSADINVKQGISKTPNSIQLSLSSAISNESKEAYHLNINNKGITIEGNSAAGIFYGIQSLRALFPVEVYGTYQPSITIPCIEITDAPQYEYRGMLLDVARNFTPQKNVLKLIDLLSFYKINKLQLNLADDEGWRLEIQNLPELTSISSKRGHTLDERDRLLPSYGSGSNGSISLSNGYYSKDDFIEIIKYANDRHIEIIPAIDLPGHARAAINAMKIRYANNLKKRIANPNQYLISEPADKSVYLSVQQFNDNVICPCEEGIYNFINTVVGDIKAMYKEANVPISTIHIGSDEVPAGVWTKSPACDKLMRTKNIKNIEGIKSYFLERCISIFKDHQLTTSFYEDALLSRNENKSISVKNNYVNNKVCAYAWNNVWGEGSEDIVYKLANTGYPVVLMNVTNLYLDHAYSTESDEPGLYWGAGYVDSRKIFEFTPLNIFNCAYINKDGDSLSSDLFRSRVRLNPQNKKYIHGIQGALFSETLKYEGMMEYYSFPKVIALAERAWSKNPKWADIENKAERISLLQKDWNLFANALGQQELPRLDKLNGGVNYQLPAPGMMLVNQYLQINSPFPGLIIRYTLDGTEPTERSSVYTNPVKPSKLMKAALFSPHGKRGKIATLSIS